MTGHIFSPASVIAAVLTLIPFLSAIFFPATLERRVTALPLKARFLFPVIFSLPYALISISSGIFQWDWFLLYLLLPVAVSFLLWQARCVDPNQHGNWRDFTVLATLGLAVDLRWFESAWPPYLGIFNKLLLLNIGLYGFLVCRKLDGVGLDLRLRWQDIRIGLREFAFYAPLAIALGLSLGFLHLHFAWPSLTRAIAAPLFTFFFIAIPEEIFFRGWLQNLLERRFGHTSALLFTAILFGLSHFNKRAAYFNWRYVLLATLAGIFYGRAWLEQRRVAASTITHTVVDTVWSLWLR